ncbi:AAA family ATPase [Brevibacillus brevis]|uniref:AAA family ATPase n=1 Tax=Brevibacillus brevis TaxID=1393 RepID=A0ABY9T7Z7_BREBE|nr:AAA family ATPase [Brevibacillus brevis]WNC16038.1 AAA family ATPase [Brevibacillus brevis]
MQKLMMLAGIAGSGKSRRALELAKKERAIIVSTDEIRQNLFGDEGKQKKTSHVFREVYARVEDGLAKGSSVILDATNIDREKRMNVLSKFAYVEKVCYYLNVPYAVCLERNQARKRKVPGPVMEKMRKNFHFPIRNEGFDRIWILHEEMPYPISKEAFVDLLQSEPSYEELFEALQEVPIFQDMVGFQQENPHHTHTLCRHTYHVLEYVNAFYSEEDKLLMQVVALFHDTGKPFCKVYKPAKGHYSYYGHENVSAQIACHFLKELQFDDAFIFKAVHLIQMHMKINYGTQQDISEIYRLLGEEMLWKLYFFKEADTYAK